MYKQKLVTQPKAIYTHCYAHCTNLVLVEATSTNQYARNFFGIAEKFLETARIASLLHAHRVSDNFFTDFMRRFEFTSVITDSSLACRCGLA